MNPVFERNLRALLTRSYEPARPRAAFARELRERALASLPRARSRDRSGPTWVGAVSQGLAAAAVLLALLAPARGALLRWLAPGPRPLSAPDELLARGEAAVRENGAGWSAAGARLPWLAPRLEVAASSAAPVEVRTPSGDRVAVAPGGRIELVARAEGPQLVARSGRVELEKAPFSPAWEVEAPGGRLSWERGGLALAVVEGGPAGGDRRGAGWTSVRARSGAGSTVDGTHLVGDLRGTLRAGVWVPDAAQPPGDASAAALEPGQSGQPGEPGSRTSLAASAAPEEAPAESATAASVPGPPGPPADEVPGPPPGSSSLRGVVRGVGDGAPLASFRVWVRQEVSLPKVSEPRCHVFTAADGHFEVGDLGAGRYTVLVEAEDHAAWRSVGVELGETPVELDITLGPGGAVQGFALDAASDTPLAGALVLAELDIPQQVVEMHGFERDPMPFAHARTDANGAFELPHLSVGPHTLRVSHPGYAPVWIEVRSLGDGQTLELEAARLGTGGTIVGRAERPDGTPAAGAEIIASRIDMQQSVPTLDYGFAETAPDGTYRIEHLAPGPYVVMNLDEQPNELPEWSRLHQTNVRSGDEVRVDFLSALKTTRVAGRLLTPGGEPLAGWFITLATGEHPNGFSGWTATQSGADGRFEFLGAAAGPAQLFLGRNNNELLMHVATVEVLDGPSTALDVALADTELSGRVVDSRSGTPVVGALFLERFDPSVGDWAFAGRGYWDGGPDFRFRYLAPGRYRVRVFDVPDLADGASEVVELAAGAPRDVELPLAPGGSLQLEVLDEAGAPVEGAGIGVVASGDPERDLLEYRTTPRTDEGGGVRLGHLPLEPVEVRVDASGYAPARLGATPTAEGALVRVVLARN